MYNNNYKIMTTKMMAWIGLQKINSFTKYHLINITIIIIMIKEGIKLPT